MSSGDQSFQTVRQQLIEELNESDLCDLYGVVSPRGLGGAKFEDDRLWTILLRLAAWRVSRSDLQRSELFVFMLADDSTLERFYGAVRAFDVVHLKARVLEENCHGKPSALLEQVVGAAADLELAEISRDLRAPVEFVDARLGRFVLDRRLNCFEGAATWCAAPIELTLDPAQRTGPRVAAGHAAKLLDDQRAWDQRLRACAAEHLLSLCNDSWREPADARVSDEEFKSRMVPRTLEVDSDGNFSLWYDDGDLFWGHAIVVRGDLAHGPNDAELAG